MTSGAWGEEEDLVPPLLCCCCGCVYVLLMANLFSPFFDEVEEEVWSLDDDHDTAF